MVRGIVLPFGRAEVRWQRLDSSCSVRVEWSERAGKRPRHRRRSARRRGGRSALPRPWPAARSDWAVGKAAAKVVLPRSLAPSLVPLNNSVDEKSGGVPNVAGFGEDSAVIEEAGKCVRATVIRKA